MNLNSDFFHLCPLSESKSGRFENYTLETEWVRNTPNWIQACEPAVRFFHNSLEFQQLCWNAKSENEKENLKKEAMEFDDLMKQSNLR